MCGITGIISPHPIPQQKIKAMLDTLAHRGPDGEGISMLQEGTIALGHKRLSFLDLSESGKQPMPNHDEKVWVTFNGEIYNFLELKSELEGHYNFQSNSDTEVVIAAYQYWGLDFVNQLKGMFAFALVDLNLQKSFLVRDRFGIKPLYYSLHERSLYFGSELKSILASGDFQKEINFSAFADFFVYRYIPTPMTIWKGIYKLSAAHYLVYDHVTQVSEITEYWKLNSGENNYLQQDIVEQVNALLSSSVREHVRSDVPVGSFLSGGYDSSALVYYMTQQGLQPETFSIGFVGWGKSEDQFAQIVSEHLGAPNTSVGADENSLKLIREMPMVYDEPIADISIIPTYMVSQLARKQVKAVLSGEGADELFGGYTWQHDFFERHYPTSWKGKLKKWLQPISTVDFYAEAMAMGWFDKEELKKMLQSHLHQYIPEDVHWFYRKHFKPDLTPFKSVQYLDIKCFMGELVLTKIDRASMANSLEVRVPFLDHELFEYQFSLAETSYIDRQQTKKILFENIKNVLPSSILDRKKQGFVGPDDYYMNLEWYKKELSNSRLVALNIVRQEYIDELLKESYNWKLWKIVVMEFWVREWIEF
jgi:asparagine synthase (glutamine-hydrolysing)